LWYKIFAAAGSSGTADSSSSPGASFQEISRLDTQTEGARPQIPPTFLFSTQIPPTNPNLTFFKFLTQTFDNPLPDMIQLK